MPINNTKPLLLYILITFQIFLITPVLGQLKISMKQAIDLALERNLQIKLAIVEEKNGQENLSQARYSQLPTISANSQTTSNWGRTLNITTYSYIDHHVELSNWTMNTQLTIFQGGQLRNQVIENKLLLEIDKGNIDKIKNDLVLNVVTNYLQCLSDEDILAVAREQITVSKENIRNIQKTVDLGKKTVADLAVAQADLTTAELNVANAENAIESSMLTLKQYLEINSDATIDLEKPDLLAYKNVDLNIVKEEIFDQAENLNPNLKVAIMQKRAAEENIQIAKGLAYPTISLIGALNSNYSSADKKLQGVKSAGVDTIGAILGTGILVGAPRYENNYVDYPFFKQLGNNFNQYMGIGIQIPILNHFYAQSAVRKSKNADETAALNVRVATESLYKIIDQAILDLKAANKNYLAAFANLQSLKEAYRIVFTRYNLNLSSTLELRTATSKLNKAEFDLIQYQYNLIFRRKIIDYYIGKPLTL